MQDRIERLFLNYSNARKSWEAWHFMNDILFDTTTMRHNYEESIKKKVDENALLSHFRYLTWKDYQIEIYKIVKDSSNTEDNIFLLLKELLRTRPDLKDSIEKHLEELENLKPDIKKITDLRDKFYAHLDKNYMNYAGGNTGMEPYQNIFVAVEQAIITLTSLPEFQNVLDRIPSRHEFYL